MDADVGIDLDLAAGENLVFGVVEEVEFNVDVDADADADVDVNGDTKDRCEKEGCREISAVLNAYIPSH